MISSIEITRFRGIREGKLEDLTPLVVLVGPNGCGKSSILDAMMIGAASDPASAANSALRRHKGLARPARWFCWRARRSPATRVAVTIGSQPRAFEIEVVSDTELRCVPVSRKKSDEAGPGTSARLTASCDVRLVEPRAFETRPLLHELYTQTVEQGRRDKAMAIIRAIVPGAQHFEILTDGNEPVLHLVFGDHSVPVAIAGDGVCALARLSLELASVPGGVVLLEEPEVHQHPGAILQTVRAILAAVRREIQVILTTHSLELIDAVLAESSDADLERLSLYRLQLDEGDLISRRMSGSEVEFARCEIENDLR